MGVMLSDANGSAAGREIQARPGIGIRLRPEHTNSRHFLKRVALAAGAPVALLARVSIDLRIDEVIAAIGVSGEAEARIWLGAAVDALRAVDWPVTGPPVTDDPVNGSIMAMAFAPTPHAMFALCVGRPPGVAEFGRSDTRVAERLRPWLDDWLRLWWHQQRQAARYDCLHAALEQAVFGVIMLDASGNLVEANGVAAELLDAGDGLRRLGRGIGAATIDGTARLHTLVHEARGAGEFASAAVAPVTATLRRRDRAPITVAAARARLGRASDDGDPAVVLFIVDPEIDLRRRIAAACANFGLSPTETRLVQHVVAGLTLAEAAVRMRIQRDTARVYLKQVFAKTGVNRQANLVRLMLLSLAPIEHAARQPHDTPV